LPHRLRAASAGARDRVATGPRPAANGSGSTTRNPRGM